MNEQGIQINGLFIKLSQSKVLSQFITTCLHISHAIMQPPFMLHLSNIFFIFIFSSYASTWCFEGHVT